MIDGLAARITQAREQAGLSKARLAELIGLPRQNLILIEQGKTRDPRIDAMAKLAQVCGVTLDWLLGVQHAEAASQPPTTLGQRIARARKIAGYSETELAHVAGLTREKVRRLENGKERHPGVESIKHLAEACGVSADWLVGLTPEPHAKEKNNESV